MQVMTAPHSGLAMQFWLAAMASSGGVVSSIPITAPRSGAQSVLVEQAPISVAQVHMCDRASSMTAISS